jgi:hypothetical protein
VQKNLLALTLGLTSVLAAPAIAQDAQVKPAKEKMVCRAEESTGSIMRKRTCHTKAEWVEIDKQNAAASKDAMDRRNDGSLKLGSSGDTGISPTS